MINWDNKYSTGDENIDKQHKMLFEFFNDLENAINEGHGSSYAESSMQFLEDYAKAHFTFEEDCFKRHKCPYAQKNKEAHDMYLDKFLDFKKELDTYGYSDALLKELHHFVEQWIHNHIIEIDTHLLECINKKSA